MSKIDDLTKLRDELAAKYKDSVSDGTSLTEKTTFVYGWNALLSHLTEVDLGDELDDRFDNRQLRGMLVLANARIRLAEQVKELHREESAARDVTIKQLEGKLSSTNDYVKMIETRNSELIEMSEKAQDEWREICFVQRDELTKLDILRKHSAELQLKLTATEARLAESEEAWIKARDRANMLNDKLLSAEARIKELGAELTNGNYTGTKWPK